MFFLPDLSIVVLDNQQLLRTWSGSLQRTKRDMGAVFSRGRKYYPRQIDTVHCPDSSLEHARFACGDAPKKSTALVLFVFCFCFFFNINI